jgi:hypothetical protein
MDRQPQERAGDAFGGARPESVDAAANRRRAVELRRAAEEAGVRTTAIRAAAAARRGGALSFRDQMAVWQETYRTLRELEETARELAAHGDEAEREAAEQTAWVRGQVERMLDAGWTREELADIGIADELLAQVGMADDPRLRGEPGGAGTRPGRPPEPRR